MKVGVGMGSNLGDRGIEIAAAADFLRTLDPTVRVSPTYESRPKDCPPGSGMFYNAAAVMDWKGGLFGLLEVFQKYERGRGRPAEREVNAPRAVDLDLLFCENLALTTPRLILPHPRMKQRHFVLRPLADLLPDFTIPGEEGTVSQCCQQFEKNHPGELCRQIA